MLGKYLKRAGDECKHACNIYASKTAEKEFGGLLEVALHIKLVLDSGVPSSELPSHPGCDRDAVGKVLIRFGSTNARSFQVLPFIYLSKFCLTHLLYFCIVLGASQAGQKAFECITSSLGAPNLDGMRRVCPRLACIFAIGAPV